MMKAGCIGRLVNVNYFKDNEETVSGVCRILSTAEPSFPPFSEEEPTGSGVRGYHTLEIVEISRVAIAVEKLPCAAVGKKCDASTNQSNNFSVSRKRFKPSTPGSKPLLSFTGYR